MFTVVIPTMWKSNTTESLLEMICDSSCINVDEIIIINNDHFNTPNIKILNHEKILMITPDFNIIVNPSWNLGVRLSKNKNICLLNDDIIFDQEIFNFMSNHLEKNLCGLRMEEINPPIRLSEADTRCHGFGCMMFVKKDSYDFIPNELRLFYGDDYLFQINKIKGNKVYYIDGCKNNQTWGVTSKNGVEVRSLKISNEIDHEKQELERLINEKNYLFHSK